MNRETISHLAHTHHPVAAPLSDAAVARLLDRALPRGTERVLDLGCGPGEWLLRALHDRPGVHAVGVDTSRTALDRAAGAAQALGVADRLSLHQKPAADHTDPHPYDLVLSIGASHAFGGLLPTLDAARAHLAPGGHVLVGDGYWEHPPTPGDREDFGPLADLPTTVDQVTAAGWTPVYGHLSTREERDDYEWSWTGSLAAWALDHPDHPDSAEALDAANGHRTEWLRGYRATWGFATFLLRRTAD
ncbi:class I SAM-dependent methyltransferase [Streptomyces sp. A0592]|uniref:SAM-dependent methyltransferase n=1 Tax=Streptomyces sp. A0592 TaxID=2563099 RepID=UPI00109E5F1A|nr:class I SAM-dependent methyltransferase [Streptomyces sp. A0592]THA82406.1 class I SAM-dependent methyltransferase [Streptomyces sp. A0592]